MPVCPECRSQRTWKDGLRHVQGVSIQRYICRSCGCRFSNNRYNECQTINSRQICVSEGEMKNLVRANQKETALRESAQEHKGEIIAFGWHMQKRGLSEETIKHRMYRLNVLVQKGANLEDPETVETILAVTKWSKANRKVFADIYKSYCNYQKIDWIKPKFCVPNKEPFLPLEAEVQQLIAGCGKKTSTLLQLLYETGVRIGEAAQLKWSDIDFESKKVRVNCPEKGGNSRTLPLSNLLIEMLKGLSKREDGHLFTPKARSLTSIFTKSRNRLAIQLQNPRLKDIHFHTLRHLKATLTYYKTGDILLVKYLLGHKRLDTTGRYAHYQAFKNKEYVSKVALNPNEACALIDAGWDFVSGAFNDGGQIFRKRK